MSPTTPRYVGEVGDVVVGRIVEVGQKRWKVELHAKLDSVLLLSSVNLPGGELRRRSEEDERMMREYLQEGDLISAEVQALFSDGSLSLHTRSLKYGKLGQGTLVRVSPSLIKRRKSHFHSLPCGATIILGNNGYVWICRSASGTDETENTGGFVQNLEPVPRVDREVIGRLRNVVLCLAEHGIPLYDTTVMYGFEASSKFQVSELWKPDVSLEIVSLTRQRLESEL